MPLQYRALGAEEKENLFTKRGQMDLTDFEDIVRDLKSGDAIEVELDGVTVRAMKRRIGQAAKSVLGLPLRYKTSDDGKNLLFVVQSAKQTRAPKKKS